AVQENQPAAVPAARAITGKSADEDAESRAADWDRQGVSSAVDNHRPGRRFAQDERLVTCRGRWVVRSGDSLLFLEHECGGALVGVAADRRFHRAVGLADVTDH